jgi:TPP-dependent pyruvate/acetoin dehydrogenase alpha subunit
MERNLAGADALRRVEEEARAGIEQALAFALEAPYPDPAEVSEDVYARG